MLESKLRDQLAERLELLEPGLRHVGTEVPLKNRDGTEGRSDILARDRHGNLVVIEVKRSKGSSREAAHQVFKYAETLCREQGLPIDRVRIMVASTEWRELDRSFSGYAEQSGFDVRGFRLLLDGAGASLADAEPVKPKGPARAVIPSDIQISFAFDSPEDRERCWDKLRENASSYGVDHLLGFDFVGRPDGFASKSFLLYLVIGSLDPEDPRTANIDTSGYEVDQFRDHEHLLQQAAIKPLLAVLTRRSGVEDANPVILNRLLTGDPHWIFEERVRCNGDFELQNKHYETRDWIAAVTVSSGFNQRMFIASGDPSNRAAWEALKRKVSMALGTNPDWRDLAAAALERLEDDYPSADVSILILNPTDLVGVLVSSWPDKLREYEPQLQIRINSDHGLLHAIDGVLMARPNLEGFQGRFRAVYRSPDAWMAARMSNVVPEMDLELLDALELQYILMEQVRDPHPHVRVHRIDGDLPETVAMPMMPVEQLREHGILPLADFCEEHFHAIDELIMEYRQSGLVPGS
jgi:hypothetical protein